MWSGHIYCSSKAHAHALNDGLLSGPAGCLACGGHITLGASPPLYLMCVVGSNYDDDVGTWDTCHVELRNYMEQ